MKTIILTQGQVTIVDDSDYEKLIKFKWCAMWDSRIKVYYAVRNSPKPNSRLIYIHREIMNAPKGKKVDHKNHNTLDNRKDNLRVCTNAQNGMNRKGAQTNSKSGIRGVSWKSSRNKWKAQIRVNGKTIYLGLYTNKNEATKVYAKANQKYFGEFGGRLDS